MGNVYCLTNKKKNLQNVKEPQQEISLPVIQLVINKTLEKRLLIKENFISYKKYLNLDSHYKGDLLFLHCEISGYLPADASSPLNELPL